MADEELEVDVEQKQKKKERPIRRIAVRDSDVNRTLRDEVIEITQQTLDDTEGVPVHKDTAQRIKQRLDKEKGGMWHVIVGSHFGGNVTNDASTLMNFQVDSTWYLVFRSGPPEKVPEAHHK